MTSAIPAVGGDDVHDDYDDYAPPPLLVWASFALALIGLAISGYMTFEHYTGNTTLACTEGGLFNCAAVTTSKYAYILHIPVAVLGLVQFVTMAALCSPWAWRAKERWIHIARFAFAVLGMLTVLWLLTVELAILGELCVYCTGVHVVTFTLFVLVIVSVPRMLGWTER